MEKKTLVFSPTFTPRVWFFWFLVFPPEYLPGIGSNQKSRWTQITTYRSVSEYKRAFDELFLFLGTEFYYVLLSTSMFGSQLVCHSVIVVDGNKKAWLCHRKGHYIHSAAAKIPDTSQELLNEGRICPIQYLARAAPVLLLPHEEKGTHR